jgi:HTH-type transcriptional regulator/antitoxin HipB
VKLLTVSDRILPTWSATLGAAIRQRRKAFGLSQQELADTAGCSKLILLQLESGKPTARLELAVRILTTLGLELRIEEGSDGIVDRP